MLGPTHLSQHLKLVLFRPTEQQGSSSSGGGSGHAEYVAAGSLGLEPLLEHQQQRQQRLTVPVVDEVRHTPVCCPQVLPWQKMQQGWCDQALPGGAAKLLVPLSCAPSYEGES